jgi:hypothetical protein
LVDRASRTVYRRRLKRWDGFEPEEDQLQPSFMAREVGGDQTLPINQSEGLFPHQFREGHRQ